MMRRIMPALVIASALGACAAPDAGGGNDLRPGDREAIVARSRAVVEAEQRGDRAALDDLMAGDYRYLSSVGRADRSKAEEIDHQMDFEVVAFSIEKVRVAPLAADMAVVHSFIHQQVRRRSTGEMVCPYGGSMEAWRRDIGAWRLVARTEWLVSWDASPGCAPRPPIR